MHSPALFSFDDLPGKIEFIRQNSFATIVTCIKSLPVATLLPFAVDDRNKKLVLRSHFSAANKQARYISSNPSIIIFNGPHAYISPSNYDKKESVPTWNYITVHAYGTIKVLDDEASKRMVVEEMIRSYESGYLQQWKSLPEKYTSGMLHGIIAFELEVTELIGQKKLSQNKTHSERERIIQQLNNSGNENEKNIAAYMYHTK